MNENQLVLGSLAGIIIFFWGCYYGIKALGCWNYEGDPQKAKQKVAIPVKIIATWIIISALIWLGSGKDYTEYADSFPTTVEPITFAYSLLWTFWIFQIFAIPGSILFFAKNWINPDQPK
jgi:hypothetical protein